ncbi:MAG: glycosyltransferase [Fibromonadaceae bacterium]|jgi:glycosyltransferase involved in cell wall biosynthesis|nr:glycosyltransferase [Fibromonadaceae bacterium]
MSIVQNHIIKEKIPYVFEPAILKYPETQGLVSVIIPIYNTELYLQEALDSIVVQTFRNWEAILIDDGSTDKSPEICMKYVEKDSRFKYIKKDNSGALLARKTGLEYSRGEFIANLDSDDAYNPRFLEKMLAKMKEGSYDFVWCDYEDLDGRISIKPDYIKFTENKLENCRNVCYFKHYTWNKLAKRSIYAKVLFPQIITFGEDLIQTLQIIYHSENAEFVPEKLNLHRLNCSTSTSVLSSVTSKEKLHIQYVVYTIANYILMSHFFGTNEAERFFVDIYGEFENYFILSKKTIVRNKIEYAENFVPDFLRGLKKSKKKDIHNLFLIWACKGFLLPFKLYIKHLEIRGKLKIRTYVKKNIMTLAWKFKKVFQLLKFGMIHPINNIKRLFSSAYPRLPYIEAHVSNHCNLSCKGCTHYCNTDKHPSFPSIESFEKDLKRMAQLFGYIERFRLLGGEPFLNPELNKFMFLVRSYFPISEVELVSNGLLIVKQEAKIWNYFLKYDVNLLVSCYPPTLKLLPNIESVLKKHKIKYKIFPPIETFLAILTKSTNNNPVKSSAACKKKGLMCTILHNGKIAKCPNLMFIDKLNRYCDNFYSNESDIIDIYNAQVTGRDILQKISLPANFCKYCSEYPRSFNWSSGNSFDIQDWLA